jgi:hypothetical protein
VFKKRLGRAGGEKSSSHLLAPKKSEWEELWLPNRTEAAENVSSNDNVCVPELRGWSHLS